MKKLIHKIAIRKSRKYLSEKYGAEWFSDFYKLSCSNLEEILPEMPDIGNSIFAMNYNFAAAYIAWYKSFEQLGVKADEIDKDIWAINEKLMYTFPKSILKISGKIYLSSFRKKAAKHIKKQQQNKLHPYDWKIAFRNIDHNSFEIDITECAFKKLSKDFGVEKMLPGICRMDYLMANIMGNGFARTKTLGDGDECCNCRYAVSGSCEWSPEKGFEYRK